MNALADAGAARPLLGARATFGLYLDPVITDLGTLIGLFNIVGSLLAGHLGSRRPKTYLLWIIYALRGVVITAFILVPVSATTMAVFGAAMGLVWLATVPLTGGIVAAQFGTTRSGTLFGFVFSAHQIGAFVGVWMAGLLADRTGSYLLVWWIAIGLAALAAVLHLFIDDRPAPPAPVGSARAGAGGFAPAGAAAVIVVLGAAAALSAPPRRRRRSRNRLVRLRAAPGRPLTRPPSRTHGDPTRHDRGDPR